jgi:hypothetical protein
MVDPTIIISIISAIGAVLVGLAKVIKASKKESEGIKLKKV